MSRPKLAVQHCVVNGTTRQYGPHPTSDLLGVDFYQSFPADAEFPKALGKVDVFVRFYPNGCGPTPIQVRVYRLNPDRSNGELVYRHRFADVPFDPTTKVFDRVFRLVNVHLPARGLYAVYVCRPRMHRWKGLKRVWVGTDTFEVV